MNKLNLFVPLAKVAAAKRIVEGIAVEEVVDKAGEMFDYVSSKPLFELWSADIARATGGKSLGNVRAMHGKVAAGKLTAIKFDDPAKQITIAAKIVDDAEWAKVEQGVYTGFSIGGRYVKQWKDEANPQLIRYTADPIEISIVDLPCVGTARLTMVKADGTTELRRFKPGAGLLSARGRAEKSLMDVGRLASFLDNLIWLQQGLNYEALAEAEPSLVPAELKAAIATIANILRTLCDEEIAEAEAELEAGKSARAAALRKSVDDAVTNVDDAIAKVMGPIREQLGEVLGALKRIEATPMPGGPARFNVISKTGEQGGGTSAADLQAQFEKLSADERVELLIKLAQANGRAIGPAGT